MSYLVLARKWRPQTFEDVVGQQVGQGREIALGHAIVPAAQALCGGRCVAHAGKMAAGGSWRTREDSNL